MIDQFMIKGANDRDVLVNPNYSPDQAVLDMHLTDPYGARCLAAVFTPWHTRPGDKHFVRLEDRLVAEGWAVLTICLNDYVLSPDLDLTLSSYANIGEVVPEELDQLTNERGYESVYGIGASLGNVALGVVAKRFENFSGATMIVAGSNLATSMWEGTRTQGLRKMFTDLDKTAEEVNEAWLPIAPKTNAVAFKDKPTELIISKTDTIIPTVYQREMADSLIREGSSVSQRARLMGHYASVGYYCHWGRLPQVA